ncbi:MAG: HPr(Ser) kinase/phosphatase [Nitrosomonas sp.]|nr:HPr(Ser) kinase/phosphatase [Nitrosomonas sp.]
MSRIDISQLFRDNEEKLTLRWSPSSTGINKQLENTEVSGRAQNLIGYLNFVNPNWIQVLNQASITFLLEMDPSVLQKKISALEASNPFCLIVADNLVIPDSISEFSCRTRTPLLRSSSTGSQIIWLLHSYLVRNLAPTISCHGVLLDVLGMGVMITGESGVGKSELALELISRGHGLVADDVIELSRIGPETLEGCCPPLLRDFIEVRGLGMLNIRTIFGETAVRRRKNMKLIVYLEKSTSSEIGAYERLPLSNLNEEILNVRIRKVTIPVAAGRNLAVLVEAAVRNYILQLRGIDSTQDFVRRHELEMDGNIENHDEDHRSN